MEAVYQIAEAVMGGRRDLTMEEKVICEDVLDAASHWAKGTLPLFEFERAGRLPAYHPDGRGRYESHGYARFLSLVTAHPTDPRRQDLVAAIDTLVMAQAEVVHTKQGTFLRSELERANAMGGR